MTPSNRSPYAPSPASVTPLSKAGPSSSQVLPPESNTSRHNSRSPRWHLSRQASENQVSTFRSPNDSTLSEGRHSFMLSLASCDFRDGGSFGGSSDGWSMRTFSELVASQRERWSFDSENASPHGKVTRSNSHLLASPSAELQACGICSKLLRERSSFGGHKLIIGSELSVVSVLFCGHVFHAECLESMTSETNKFDPPCPVCTVGEKPAFKIAVKLAKADIESRARNKLSRIGVADSEFVSDVLFSNGKKGRKGGSKLGASSSMKSPFVKPFLRRHFSMGGMKSSRPASQEESTTGKKKSFWGRYRKD